MLVLSSYLWNVWTCEAIIILNSHTQSRSLHSYIKLGFCFDTVLSVWPSLTWNSESLLHLLSTDTTCAPHTQHQVKMLNVQFVSYALSGGRTPSPTTGTRDLTQDLVYARQMCSPNMLFFFNSSFLLKCWRMSKYYVNLCLVSALGTVALAVCCQF